MVDPRQLAQPTPGGPRRGPQGNDAPTEKMIGAGFDEIDREEAGRISVGIPHHFQRGGGTHAPRQGDREAWRATDARTLP